MSKFAPGNQYGKHANHQNAGRKPRFDEQLLDRILNRGWPVKERIEVIRMLATKAIAGDVAAATLLLNYAYGKPKQQLEHAGSVQFGRIETWQDVEAECERLGIDAGMAREECRRLIESAEQIEDEDEEEGEA
jgi:hypothetical protein